MRRHLIIVCGTGTGVGKTHVTETLLRGWGRTALVCGLKPIESGVPAGSEGDDSRRLRQASTFHVKQSPPYVFEPPVSPHLAARQAGVTVDPVVVRDFVAAAAAGSGGAIVELPGGLYTPVGVGLTNADLVGLLRPARVLLVAPNRIGVLHDIGAATRAASASGLAIDGIILSETDAPDESSPTNAAEVAVVTEARFLCTLPRGSAEDLARAPEIEDALKHLLRPLAP